MVDVKKAAIGAALIFVGMKGFTKNKTADQVLVAVGGITLIHAVPMAAAYVG